MNAILTFSLALADDMESGRARIRLPMDRMADIGLRAGDTVAITGERTTHARVIPGPRGASCAWVSPELMSNTGGKPDAAASLTPVALSPLATAVLQVEDGMLADPRELAEALHDIPLTLSDRLTVTLAMGRKVRLRVADLGQVECGLFTDKTVLSLQAQDGRAAGYEAVGGLAEQIDRIHEMVAAPLLRPELFDRLGIRPPRGILFTGPPGSGKTLLARTVAANTAATFFQINGPEIVSKHYGDSEAALRQVFASAAKSQPAIIFIDEIDAIAPRREGLSGEKQVERRIVAQLLTLMDGLEDRGSVVVMAATNLPDTLDPALRRPGRFDREISFAPPDAASREDILRIHLKDAPLHPKVDLAALAALAQGYVGADLAALTREAALAALKRAIAEAGSEAAVRPDTLFITQTDLESGLAATSPSALRDTHVDSTPIRWSDIGGLDAQKHALTEAVMWPLEHAALHGTLRLTPARGVLLSGPPGSGKTLIARALAHESRMNFILVRPAKILSQFLGDAERAIADIFQRARQTSPTLIFFDELDGLAPRRGGNDAVQDRIVAQLLAEMDGLSDNTNVVVIGATNRAATIDPALTRPGRFDLILPIPLPETAARAAILRVHLAQRPLADEVNIDELARLTTGFSGAGLANLVSRAARAALGRCLRETQTLPQITPADFALAIAAETQAEAQRATDFIRQEVPNVPT